MSEKKTNYEKLCRLTLDQGISLYGVADITGIRKEFKLDKRLTSKFDKALSLGKKLNDAIIEDITDRPTPLYFHHYRQLNFFLDRIAFILSSYIQDLGYRALPIPASQVIDWEKQQAHLSHKKVGYLAGLGWIGRNNLLVSSKLGSRFRLVTVLTDLPLETDRPLKLDCGNCKECLKVCPVNAIKEKQQDFDHVACYEKLQDFRKTGLVGQYICGVCIKACPGQERY